MAGRSVHPQIVTGRQVQPRGDRQRRIQHRLQVHILVASHPARIPPGEPDHPHTQPDHDQRNRVVVQLLGLVRFQPGDKLVGVARRITRRVERRHRCPMDGDMVWMTVTAIRIKRHHHLRAHPANHLHNLAGEGVWIGLPQRVGMVIVRRAHHAAVPVAKGHDLVQPQFFRRTGQFRQPHLCHRSKIPHKLRGHIARFPVGCTDQVDLHPAPDIVRDRRPHAKRFIIRMCERNQQTSTFL